MRSQGGALIDDGELTIGERCWSMDCCQGKPAGLTNPLTAIGRDSCATGYLLHFHAVMPGSFGAGGHPRSDFCSDLTMNKMLSIFQMK